MGSAIHHRRSRRRCPRGWCSSGNTDERRGAASSRAIQYAEAVEAALAVVAAMSCWLCSASLPLTLRALLLTVAREY